MQSSLTTIILSYGFSISKYAYLALFANNDASIELVFWLKIEGSNVLFAYGLSPKYVRLNIQ